MAAHVTLAIAVRMMGEGLRYVSSTRGAAGLMQSIIKEAHKQLIEVRWHPASCMLHKVAVCCNTRAAPASAAVSLAQ